MGGYGSGQRWSKKRVVETCRTIDTASLKRWNLLVPGITDRAGSLEWGSAREKNTTSVGYRLTVETTIGTLRLM